MPLQNAYSREVAAISRMGGRHNACEGDGIITAIGKPPCPEIEIRHGRRIEERQPMQISQGLGNVIIGCIDHTNFVHCIAHSSHPTRSSLAQHDLHTEPDGPHQAGRESSASLMKEYSTMKPGFCCMKT